MTAASDRAVVVGRRRDRRAGGGLGADRRRTGRSRRAPGDGPRVRAPARRPPALGTVRGPDRRRRPGRLPRAAPRGGRACAARSASKTGSDRSAHRVPPSTPGAGCGALPAGLLLGVPDPLVADRPLGGPGRRPVRLRLLRDALAPRSDRRGPLGDRALGPMVARRLGTRVVDALVDPLIGGIHAGSVADMSTAAVLPQLLAVRRRGGLMRALRRQMRRRARRDGDGDAPRPRRRSGRSRAACAPWSTASRRRFAPAASSPRPEPRPSRLDPPAGAAGPCRRRPVTVLDADGIVLAVPANVAGDLLADPRRRRRDARAHHRVRLGGGGHPLVPGRRRDAAARHRASSSRRGPPSPLAAPGADDLLHHGRDVPRREVAAPGRGPAPCCCGPRSAASATGGPSSSTTPSSPTGWRPSWPPCSRWPPRPTATLVTRWRHAFPQYRVGHLLRVSGIEAAVKRLPALAVAGAPYRGVGIPACIGSGREAARRSRWAPLADITGRDAAAEAGSSPRPWRPESCWPSRSRPSACGRSPSSAPRSSIGASAASASGPGYWPAGWPASAASPSACLGRLLQLVRGGGPRRSSRRSSRRRRRPPPPGAGRARRPSSGPPPSLEAARMAWPFGGLPVGGVFLGQAGGPLLAAARLGGPAAAHRARVGRRRRRWPSSARAPPPGSCAGFRPGRCPGAGSLPRSSWWRSGPSGPGRPDGGPAGAAPAGGGRPGRRHPGPHRSSRPAGPGTSAPSWPRPPRSPWPRPARRSSCGPRTSSH